MRFLAFIFILSQLAGSAQGFKVRHYLPGVVTQLSKAIFESSPGNYITGGIIVDSANGVYSQRLCITGLDGQGQLQWVKKYGSNKFGYLDNPFISRSYFKHNNDLYYAGAALDSNNKYLGVLIKFNLSGDTLWQKRFYDSSDYVYPQMLTLGVDGGILITGMFEDPVNVGRKAMLIKTDAMGNELWRKKISKVVPNVEDGKCIIQDSASKKIVIVGYQYIGNANSAGMFDNILVLDSLGDQPLRYNFLSSAGGNILDMIQTKDKKIVMVGCKYYPQTYGGFNFSKSFAIKFDLNAPWPFIWKIDGFDKMEVNNAFTCVKELSNGELLMGGGIDTMQLHNQKTNCLTRLTKVGSNGSILWNAYYDYKTNDSIRDNFQQMRSLETTADGSWIAAIDCLNSPMPNPFFFVKWDSTGCDTTQAYCQMVAAGIGKNYLNKSNISVYPNPSSRFITVSTPFSGEQLMLSIADMTGREIQRYSLNKEFQQTIDLSGLSDGVYMVSITKNKEVLYKTKLIKQD